MQVLFEGVYYNQLNACNRPLGFVINRNTRWQYESRAGGRLTRGSPAWPKHAPTPHSPATSTPRLRIAAHAGHYNPHHTAPPATHQIARVLYNNTTNIHMELMGTGDRRAKFQSVGLKGWNYYVYKCWWPTNTIITRKVISLAYWKQSNLIF
jgi:hypothetical protein